MTHKGTQVLHTKRLTLRRFTNSDAEVMFNNYANDSEVTKFLSWEPHGNIEVTKELLSSWEHNYENLSCYNWAIIFDNDLIGSIALLNPNDELCEAEAGYCMMKKHWSKGIMAEALSKVIEFAFNTIGFKRIFAKHDVKNPNSGKVMQKCGMQYIETKIAPLALNPNIISMCDFYEIFNPIIS